MRRGKQANTMRKAAEWKFRIGLKDIWRGRWIKFIGGVYEVLLATISSVEVGSERYA